MHPPDQLIQHELLYSPDSILKSISLVVIASNSFAAEGRPGLRSASQKGQKFGAIGSGSGFNRQHGEIGQT